MATEPEKTSVRKRAKYRCEYCRAPQEVTGYSFHIEHIHPRAKGGEDEVENYALACMPCNSSKSAHLTGRDPQTDKAERLFNPRKDKWNEHFRVVAKRYIRGKTATGRATVERLKMNQLRQLEARSLWQEIDLFP